MFLPIRDFRFDAEFIDFLPVTYLLKVLEFSVKEKGAFYNSLSITNALGWNSLSQSFGGEVKTTYQDWLPVRETGIKVKAGLNQPTNTTLKTLERLSKQNRIPRWVVLLLSEIDLLKTIDTLN
jgi:hypothetical protein